MGASDLNENFRQRSFRERPDRNPFPQTNPIGTHLHIRDWVVR